MKSLPQLIRNLPKHKSILYTGDDWKEYCFPKGKTLLFRNTDVSLYLIYSRPTEPLELLPSRIQVLQAELLLSSGQRIREGVVHRVPHIVTARTEEECVYLQLL